MASTVEVGLNKVSKTTRPTVLTFKSFRSWVFVLSRWHIHIPTPSWTIITATTNATATTTTIVRDAENHGGGGLGVLTPVKIFRRGRSMFSPPKMSHSFIQNCCWITLRVSHHEARKMTRRPPPTTPTPYFTTDLPHWLLRSLSFNQCIFQKSFQVWPGPPKVSQKVAFEIAGATFCRLQAGNTSCHLWFC